MGTDFSTGDFNAEMRRRGDSDEMRKASHMEEISRYAVAKRRSLFFISLCLCVSAFTFSCSSKRADVISLLPGDALGYLETNDLGKALRAITENPKFQEAAAFKPDLSAVDGVRIAVAVTGFETSEQQVTEENSILKLTPHFVAVAETNAWGWQAEKFAEDQLGEFVNKSYGGEVELDMMPKDDGTYFVWTAKDLKKAYALVLGSAILFSNDESSIEKCLAVKRGEADSVAKTGKLVDTGDALGRGYISPEGIAQLSNLAGVSMAMNTGEEGEVRGFIARVLPEILRNSVKEIEWSAVKSEKGIEDRMIVTLQPETAQVFSETMAPRSTPDPELAKFVPSDAVSSTYYNLNNPQVGWRSVLLTAQKQTDRVSGGLIVAFSSSLFEPYGVEEPEDFLSAVGPAILTVKTDREGENVAVVAHVRDITKAKASLAKELSTSKPPKNVDGAEMWTSVDEELAAVIIGGFVIAGSPETVRKCLGNYAAQETNAGIQFDAQDAAFTRGTETDPAARLIDVLSERKNGSGPLVEIYTTETRFDRNGILRVTNSDFGLIGSIIEQFAGEGATE